MTAHSLIRALLLLPLLLGLPAMAERADRDQPIEIDADRMSVDDVNRVQIFEGGVILKQGTLVIRGGHLVVTQDASGFQKGVVTGSPARFRQKREGRDEHIDGEALRIVYDARTEQAELFDKAYVKSGLDDVRGNYIIYDTLHETYAAQGRSVSGSSGKPGGRVRAVIQPKTAPTP